MLTIVCFGDLWVNKVRSVFFFLQQLDLKNKNKIRYNYTDSALMD